MKPYRTVRRIAAVALLLALTAGGDAPWVEPARAGTGGPPQIVVPKDRNGVLLTPGAATKLKVVVTGVDGRPMAGATVVFVAPDAAPNGAFKGADAAQPHIVRARTNAKGQAKATFTAGSQTGVFLVDAMLESTSQIATSFAVTVLSAPPATALRADTARRAVREQLLAELAEDQTQRLHGPVLVEAGTEVASAGPSDFVFPTEPVVVDTTSWLFWIDDNATAEFAHATRFVVLAASDAAPDVAADARITFEGWWPNVRRPGTGAADSLVPPSFGTDAFGFSVEPAGAESLERQQAPEDACAILLYGPDIGGWVNTGNLAGFLRDSGLVPAANILAPGDPFAPPGPMNPTATREDVVRLVNQVAARGCQKVYIHITAHGNSRGKRTLPDGTVTAYGGSFVLDRLDDDDRRVDDFVPDEAFVRLLEPLRGRELCFIMQSCYGGQMCEWLQGAGFTGTFVSSADRDHSSLSKAMLLDGAETALGSFFMNQLVECWRDSRADANGDGSVSLSEAYACARERGAREVTEANPKLSILDPEDARNYPLEDLKILEPGQNGTIEIARPTGISANAAFTATLTIEDRTVAAFGTGSQISITAQPGQSPQIGVTGVAEGTTNVTLVGRDIRTGQAYRGTAMIMVGPEYSLTPNPLVINLARESGGTVTLRRNGPVDQIQGIVTICITSRNEAVAKPITRMIQLVSGQITAPIGVEAVAVGETDFDVLDKRTGRTRSFRVVVVGEIPCPAEGSGQAAFQPSVDPANHDDSIRLRNARLRFMPNRGRGGGETVTIDGDRGDTVTATGALDPESCSVASAEGRGTVAGFQNVRCEYRNVVFTEGTGGTITVTGEYALGIGGELPTGQPIVYTFTVTLSSSTLQKR